jgi:hypothetical protein
MTANDPRKAVQSVTGPIAEALSGNHISVTIDLDPVVPLPDGFPPRKPLTTLAGELEVPLPVIAVRRLKPVQNWPSILRRSLQRLDQSEPSNTDPRHLHAEAREIVQSIEQQLGPVRIAAEIEYGSNGYQGCAYDHFLLVTTSHLAQLALVADD